MSLRQALRQAFGRELRRAAVPMILFCPNCGLQHIDAPSRKLNEYGEEEVWTNPPHRSHLCARCEHVWRPADVPTDGVQSIRTSGTMDAEPAIRGQARHNRRRKRGEDG